MVLRETLQHLQTFSCVILFQILGSKQLSVATFFINTYFEMQFLKKNCPPVLLRAYNFAIDSWGLTYLRYSCTAAPAEVQPLASWALPNTEDALHNPLHVPKVDS